MTSSPGIPYTYDRTHSTAAIRATYEGLEPATETGDVVRIAGRLMLRRVQGSWHLDLLPIPAGVSNSLLMRR